MTGGLGAGPGELILVQDIADRPDVLQDVLLAIEKVGATPLPAIAPVNYVERMLAEAPQSYLEDWDHHRRQWLEKVDRVLTFSGSGIDFGNVPEAAVEAWSRAVGRLERLQEERRLPELLAAVPHALQAQKLGMSLDELEQRVVPALAVEIGVLQNEIERVLHAVGSRQSLMIRSGERCELRMERGDRPWLKDDGYIDAEDRSRGAIVSNLPAGSIYTTVIEEATQGELCLARMGAAEEVILQFAEGRIVGLEAIRGADAARAEMDRYLGERIGHIGIGLNPRVETPIGWTLVDDHLYGGLFVSVGENRYMGGKNASSINVDFPLMDCSLIAEDKEIVSAGEVVV